MHIFLTGATGYIGGGIAQALQRAGHEVTGLAQSAEAAGRLQARAIQPLRGGLTDLAQIAQGAHDADAVIHTAISNKADAALIDSQVVETILNTLADSHK